MCSSLFNLHISSHFSSIFLTTHSLSSTCTFANSTYFHTLSLSLSLPLWFFSYLSLDSSPFVSRQLNSIVHIPHPLYSIYSLFASTHLHSLLLNYQNDPWPSSMWTTTKDAADDDDEASKIEFSILFILLYKMNCILFKQTTR